MKQTGSEVALLASAGTLGDMSLGLATADQTRIYLAIESQGLPALGPPPAHVGLLTSKILKLQTNPEITVLITGGLEHWCYVAMHYSKQNSITEATREIVRLLDIHMEPTNQAYGLICGFEGRTPRCFRVNRELNQSKTVFQQEDLTNIVPIGIYSEIAGQTAEEAISKGTDKMTALITAIQGLFPRENLRPPIHSWVVEVGH